MSTMFELGLCFGLGYLMGYLTSLAHEAVIRRDEHQQMTRELERRADEDGD